MKIDETIDEIIEQFQIISEVNLNRTNRTTVVKAIYKILVRNFLNKDANESLVPREEFERMKRKFHGRDKLLSEEILINDQLVSELKQLRDAVENQPRQFEMLIKSMEQKQEYAKQSHEANEELEALREKLAGRPMDTAPKDGTKILVLDANDGLMWVAWGRTDRLVPRAKDGWCVPDSEQDEQGGSVVAEYPIKWFDLSIFK